MTQAFLDYYRWAIAAGIHSVTEGYWGLLEIALPSCESED